MSRLARKAAKRNKADKSVVSDVEFVESELIESESVVDQSVIDESTDLEPIDGDIVEQELLEAESAGFELAAASVRTIEPRRERMLDNPVRSVAVAAAGG